MASALALLLAHQSDWFTTTLACIPLVFFAWVLHVAKRRATVQDHHEPKP